MALDPVLYRSPLIDPKTGGMTREWVRYFDQLKQVAILDKSNTFTKAVTISTVSGVDPSLTVIAQDYQAGIELWDKQVRVGGVTPAGGSHWRWFVDNIGGGGGSITCGFYDVAANRVAGGFDNSGIFTASQGLNVPNASAITIGSGWLSWTPAVTAGVTTVSSVNILNAKYFRVGPIVFYQFYIQMTLSGTPSNQIVVSPVTTIVGGANDYIYASTSINAGAAWQPGWGYNDPNGSVHRVEQAGEPNFPLGNTYIFQSGFYRCA